MTRDVVIVPAVTLEQVWRKYVHGSLLCTMPPVQ